METEADRASEFLDAMQEMADIMLGRRIPARVWHVTEMADELVKAAAPQAD